MLDFITRVELHPPRLSPLLSPKTAIHGYSFTLWFDVVMASFLKQSLSKKNHFQKKKSLATFSKFFHLCFGSPHDPLCFLYSTSARPIRSDWSCINQARLFDILKKTHRKHTNTSTQSRSNWHKTHLWEKIHNVKKHLGEKIHNVKTHLGELWMCLACTQEDE